VSVEVAGHGDAVGVVLQHTDGQGFDAAGNQEAVHRGEASARGALDEIDFLRVFGAGEYNAAAG